LGKVYELTGPKSQNLAEIVNEYSVALGRSIRYADVPFNDWTANELPSKGLTPHVAAHISTMARLHKENRYDRVTDDVQKITGTAATGISEWVLHQSGQVWQRSHKLARVFLPRGLPKACASHRGPRSGRVDGLPHTNSRNDLGIGSADGSGFDLPLLKKFHH
jgi:hypothetical protein